MHIVNWDKGRHVRRAVHRALWLTALMGTVFVAPGRAADTTGQNFSQLEEVVVTARKRSEIELRVPAPMSVISTQALQRQGADQFSDYLTTVPGVNFQSTGPGQTMLIIRGITTGDNVNPTVATYVDDAPFGSSTIFALGSVLTPDLDPIDIAHIEILRGPQGTLYGANAIGGLLKFATVQPDPTELSGRAEVGGESVAGGGQGWSMRAAVNLPLSHNLAVRVSGYDRDEPGYIDDPFRHLHNINDATVKGGRIAALWQINDNATLKLSALTQDTNIRDADTEDVNPTTLQPLYGDLQEHRYLPQPIELQYRLYNATLDWDFDWAHLVSSTSYGTETGHIVPDATTSYLPVFEELGLFGVPGYGPTTGATEQRDLNQTKLTEEVRLSSPSHQALEWQVGGFFTHEHSNAVVTAPTFNNVTGAPENLLNLYEADLISSYTELAGYGDVDYHFTKAFDTLVGLRFSHDEQPYTQTESGLLYCLGAGALLCPSQLLHDHTSESATTFLINPRYQLSAGSMVYARIASGYRPGGPNAVPPATLGFPLSFKADHLVDYELGWKAAVLDHRLTVDLSTFYIDWTDVQLALVENGFSGEGNGGAARDDGFEGQVAWNPLPGLILSANATYTDAVITQVLPGGVAQRGDHLPLVPRLNWGLNGDYDWNIAQDWGAFVGATYRHIGDRPNVFTLNGTTFYPVPSLPAYYTVDLRAGVSRERWTLEAYAKNLTNQRGILSLGTLTLSPASPDYSAAIIQPRTIGLSLSVTF